MHKIVTCLWFDGRVEEAIEFYTSIFAHSRVTATSRWGDTGPGRKGDILTAVLELEGQEIMLLNGGPGFAHSPAASLVVDCEDQAEVDYYWERLLDGGQESQCGWLTDRFGISWQIVPLAVDRLLEDPDEARTRRVMKALLAMVKIDIAELERAYAGE